MPCSLRTRPACPDWAWPLQKYDLKTHFWSRLGHLVGQVSLSEVVVSRARNNHFVEKVSFGVHGMTFCRGAPQAQTPKFIKTRILPARDAFFSWPPKLRIEGLAKDWCCLFLSRCFAQAKRHAFEKCSVSPARNTNSFLSSVSLGSAWLGLAPRRFFVVSVSPGRNSIFFKNVSFHLHRTPFFCDKVGITSAWLGLARQALQK